MCLLAFSHEKKINRDLARNKILIKFFIIFTEYLFGKKKKKGKKGKKEWKSSKDDTLIP